MRRFVDVINSVFAINKGYGALAVVSDSNHLFIFSRTYDLTDEGTYGKGLPGVPDSALSKGDTRKRVLFFTQDGDYRSNLALANGISSDIVIKWERFRADGSMVDSGETELEPWSNTQLNEVFKDQSPIEAAYMDVWTETPGGEFMVFSTVIDGRSGDGTVVQPQFNFRLYPPTPDWQNVCGLGQCSSDNTLSRVCDAFMDNCLVEGEQNVVLCVVGGYVLCHQDDLPDIPDGVCTSEDCADDPGLAQECEDYLESCTFPSEVWCRAGGFLICQDIFDFLD